MTGYDGNPDLASLARPALADLRLEAVDSLVPAEVIESAEIESTLAARRGRDGGQPTAGGRSYGLSPGMPPRHSGAAGLSRFRDLEDDAVPLCLVPGNRAVRDGPGEALPHAVQVALLTMRYSAST